MAKVLLGGEGKGLGNHMLMLDWLYSRWDHYYAIFRSAYTGPPIV